MFSINLEIRIKISTLRDLTTMLTQFLSYLVNCVIEVIWLTVQTRHTASQQILKNELTNVKRMSYNSIISQISNILSYYKNQYQNNEIV